MTSFCLACHVTWVTLHATMPTGPSGRIVVDVDPEFKKQLYSALAAQGSTLKDWFIRTGRDYCEEIQQPPLLRVAEQSAAYGGRENE